MIHLITMTVLGGGLALGAWAGLQAYLRRPANAGHIVVAGLLQVAALVASVLAWVSMSDRDMTEPVTFVAYSIGTLLPIPVGIWVARLERNRWGSLAICATAIVLAVMQLRLNSLWAH